MHLFPSELRQWLNGSHLVNIEALSWWVACTCNRTISEATVQEGVLAMFRRMQMPMGSLKMVALPKPTISQQQCECRKPLRSKSWVHQGNKSHTMSVCVIMWLLLHSVKQWTKLVCSTWMFARDQTQRNCGHVPFHLCRSQAQGNTPVADEFWFWWAPLHEKLFN